MDCSFELGVCWLLLGGWFCMLFVVFVGLGLFWWLAWVVFGVFMCSCCLSYLYILFSF